MGVRTTADEKRDKTKEHVQEATECLSEIVIGRCYGTDEYSIEYLNKLRGVLIGLLDIRDSF